MVKENIDYLKWPLKYFVICVDIVGSENAGEVCYMKWAVFSSTLYSL